jgi:hypothetical protein
MKQIHGAGKIAVQFAQIGGVREACDISGTKIEHPLRCFDGVVIVAQLHVGVNQVAVDGNVIRDSFVQGRGCFQSFGELVAGEQ